MSEHSYPCGGCRGLGLKHCAVPASCHRRPLPMGSPVRNRLADAIAHALPVGIYDELSVRTLLNAADAALTVLDKALARLGEKEAGSPDE